MNPGARGSAFEAAHGELVQVQVEVEAIDPAMLETIVLGAVDAEVDADAVERVIEREEEGRRRLVEPGPLGLVGVVAGVLFLQTRATEAERDAAIAATDDARAQAEPNRQEADLAAQEAGRLAQEADELEQEADQAAREAEQAEQEAEQAAREAEARERADAAALLAAYDAARVRL